MQSLSEPRLEVASFLSIYQCELNPSVLGTQDKRIKLGRGCVICL